MIINIGGFLETIYCPKPIFGKPFEVDGREYRLHKMHDGWRWRDEKEVNDSTDYGFGPWPEAWQAQQDAIRDRMERV